MPHDVELDHSNVQSQHDGVYLDGVARFPDADALRILSREQQLHAEFSSLLRLPRRCLAKHRKARRRGAESYYGRVPDRLLALPHDVSLDGSGI